MTTLGVGKCVIDSIEIVELVLKPKPGPTPGMTLEAKFVLESSELALRFGSGTFNTWSETTTQKLNDLLKSMEIDVASIVFEKGTPIASVEIEKSILEDVVPGL